MKKIIITIILIFTLFLISCSLQKEVACTMDAKICPDGSSVGRTAPNCEFAKCPDFTCDYTNNSKRYIGNSSEVCQRIKFVCNPGEDYFSDACGCGCVINDITKDENQNLCPDVRPEMCTMEYMPVCGWFNENIKCFKYPCAANYGNKCAACSDAKVKSWTQGECPK